MIMELDQEKEDLLEVHEKISKFLVKKGIKIREYAHKELKAS